MKGMKNLGRVGALALLVASSGASAQEGEAMKSILGSIGIIPKEKPPIVYNERAPLVLPPDTNLRPPVPGNAETRNGNWPKDPDVMARRKEAEEARKPFTDTDLYKNTQRLSIEEIRAGRDPNATGRAAGASRVDKNSRLSPDELRSLKAEDPKLSGDGLERRYLSDPPDALLKAAGGAPLRATVDPLESKEPDSPYDFMRKQQNR